MAVVDWLGAATATVGLAVATAMATDAWKVLGNKLFRRSDHRTELRHDSPELLQVSEYQSAAKVSVNPPCAMCPVRGATPSSPCCSTTQGRCAGTGNAGRGRAPILVANRERCRTVGRGGSSVSAARPDEESLLVQRPSVTLP